MAIHDDLLALARDLVDRNPGAQIEADLRRAVSTAYYALFHLLIHEATARLVAVTALRQRFARSFEHKIMKSVCQEYTRSILNASGQYITPAGQLVPSPIWEIARAFSMLQEARHRADYDTEVTVSHADADSEVMRAEVAFLDWAAVQTDPAADIFLAELLCRGIPKR
jgi:uncharacterized protein (UPF0332 family)